MLIVGESCRGKTNIGKTLCIANPSLGYILEIPSLCSQNNIQTNHNMKPIQQLDSPTEPASKNMSLFDEEYDEEEDILLCGLPYPLFGPRKNDDESYDIQRRLIEKDFFAGLQKDDDGFAIRRMNEHDMLKGFQQNKEKKEKALSEFKERINKLFNL
jgi:hypothetical protein